MSGYDFDYLVVGSGFGGSVSALRLSEKGYSVGVLECGRRFADDEFVSSTWDLRRYFWLPRLGCKGILRLTLFKDIFVGSGCGVGGGSLGYGNTLHVPPSEFFRDPQWGELEDWESTLAPHYAQAQRMLGVVDYDRDDQAGRLLMGLGEELGVGDTYRRTRVGVFLGEPGKTVTDPFFGGAGPDRTGCLRCGRCMVGCPHGAKNTLVKNYLWFAERRGVRVMPERTVVDIRPLDASDGSDGYAVISERSGAWRRKDRQTHRARGVVLAAGALGSNQLLARCRLGGSLPAISDRLGELVRTNSEAIVVVSAKNRNADFGEGVAIGASIYPDAHTHIETVTYGRAGDSIKFLFTLLTGDGTRVTRPLRWLAGIVRHPVQLARTLSPFGWSRRSITLLVMQTLDNAIALRARRKRFGGGVRLQTVQDTERPIQTFIPVANKAAELLAKRIDGVAQSNISEALANIPTTAHILGGAVIAADRGHGVVDRYQRVFGYENLLVCDGAAVPANVGANPSLTITALAEHAISHVPAARRDGTPAETVHASSGRSGSRLGVVHVSERMSGDEARLYGIPGSHNTAIVEAMLRHKGIAYTRRDLIPGAHRLLLVRLLGFRGSSVPALKIDGRRVIGTRAIARALEQQRPEPPLFPTDPELRRRVEDAERFGEEVMQQFPRHILWLALSRNPTAAKSFLTDARLGFPAQLAVPMIGPVVALMCRLNAATDAAARAELPRVAAALGHVDSLIDDATIENQAPNVADFQLAAQVRILMCLDDLRPMVERYRCAELAMALYPAQPGRVPPVLSDNERALL